MVGLFTENNFKFFIKIFFSFRRIWYFSNIKDQLNAAQPILGNVKDFSGGGGGSSTPAPVVGDSDGLPF